MSKRPSLAASMRAVAEAPLEPKPLPPAEHVHVKPAPAPISAPTPIAPVAVEQGAPKAFYAATRVGKKKATASLSPAAHRQLKSLTLELEDQTLEKLMVEAINDLFRKYGKQPIA